MDYRLIHIRHIRCGSWEGERTYVLAPKEWDDDRVWDAVNDAQTAYLKALKEYAENQKPPNDYRYSSQPPYDKHPDKTVREVQQEWEEKKAEYGQWKEKQKKAKLKFADFLMEQGFMPLWKLSELDEDSVFEADWGHNHSLTIDYSETEADTAPRPIQIVKPNWKPEY